MPIFSPVLFAGLLTLPQPVTLTVTDSLRADKITSHAELRTLMQALEAAPGRQLAIGHPGGEAGSARADALRAALVALGLSSERITLVPQPLDEPILIISVEKTAR